MLRASLLVLLALVSGAVAAADMPTLTLRIKDHKFIPAQMNVPANVKFKLIPWGIDQILQPQHSFKMSTNGLVAKLVRNDAGRRAQLVDQIRKYRDTIFAREVQQTVLRPLIDKMQALLLDLGVPNAVSESR